MKNITITTILITGHKCPVKKPYNRWNNNDSNACLSMHFVIIIVRKNKDKDRKRDANHD